MCNSKDFNQWDICTFNQNWNQNEYYLDTDKVKYSLWSTSEKQTNKQTNKQTKVCLCQKGENVK